MDGVVEIGDESVGFINNTYDAIPSSVKSQAAYWLHECVQNIVRCGAHFISGGFSRKKGSCRADLAAAGCDI